MQDYRELIIVQTIFGGLFTLLAIVIALNLTALITLPPATLNALILAIISAFLLKDGLPNLFLGIRNYVEYIRARKDLLSIPKKE
jgi:uncharacterized membrane protein